MCNAVSDCVCGEPAYPADGDDRAEFMTSVDSAETVEVDDSDSATVGPHTEIHHGSVD